MKNNYWLPVIVVIAACLLLTPGCENPVDDGDSNQSGANKNLLNSEIIASDNFLLATAVSAYGYEIYREDHWVTQDIADALNAALTAALTVAYNKNATQGQVNAMWLNLSGALGNADAAKKTGLFDSATQTFLAQCLTREKANLASVRVAPNGNSFPPIWQWVTATVFDTYNAAIENIEVEKPETNLEIAALLTRLQAAADIFNAAKANGSQIMTGNISITFNSSGGTSVDGAELQKGYPVAKPADPVYQLTLDQMEELAAGQEGLYALSRAFLGWFDGDYAWDFENDLVYDDKILTAKWGEHHQATLYGLGLVDISGNSILQRAMMHIDDSNEAFLLLLGGDKQRPGSTGINLRNTQLTIRSAGKQQITISPNSPGAIFHIYDAAVTVGENITLKGIANNSKPLVWIDGSAGRFTMLPGSKLIDNTIKGAQWGDQAAAAGIQMDDGRLTLRGAEISGNHHETYFNWANDGTHWQTGGISFAHTWRNGKIIIEAGSVIRNNTYGGNGFAQEKRGIRIGRDQGRVLTVSGNAIIEDCDVVNNGTAMELAGAFTGTLTLIGINADSCFSPMVYGAGYQITQADLNRIELPEGYSWGEISANSVRIINDEE